MKNVIFRIARNLGLSWMLRNIKGQKVTILNLHRISERPDFFFEPVHPSLFAGILDYCLRHYELVMFSDVSRKTKKAKLILSFDDGYYDFMEQALPLLKAKGACCNHNLVNASLTTGSPIWTQRLNDIFAVLRENNLIHEAGIVDLGSIFEGDWIQYNLSVLRKMLTMPMHERNTLLDDLTTTYGVKGQVRMMGWADALECAESGIVEIGSHTYNHDSLATVRDASDLNREIGRSLMEFRQKLNHNLTILAAPNGQFSPESISYARTQGIRHFLLVQDAAVPQYELKKSFSTPNRVYLINESIDACILRIELFFANLKRLPIIR